MKVKCIRESVFTSLTKEKVYDVLSEEGKWYRLFDDAKEEWLIPKSIFVIEK